MCEHDIRRVARFLRPSVLLEDKVWETLAFSFWLTIEQRVVVVKDFLAECYGSINNIAFEFVMSHAGTSTCYTQYSRGVPSQVYSDHCIALHVHRTFHKLHVVIQSISGRYFAIWARV